MEEKSVRDQLQTAFDREDRGEDVVKILKSLKMCLDDKLISTTQVTHVIYWRL